MEDTNNKLSLRDNLLIKILVPFCYGLGDFLSKTNFYPIRNEISDKLDKIVPYFNLDKDHEEKVMAAGGYAFGYIGGVQLELFGTLTTGIFIVNGDYKKALIYPAAKILTNGLVYLIKR